MQITKHKVATLSYELRDAQGSVLDTSQGSTPLDYIHGVGQLVPGLERALEGKRAGERIEVEIQPSEGYGERKQDLVATAAREQFERPHEIELGMQVQLQSGEDEWSARVVDIGEDDVTLDANHPLAGEILRFKVEVLDVRDATPEELSHGHVHGPGGHHE